VSAELEPVAIAEAAQRLEIAARRDQQHAAARALLAFRREARSAPI